MGYDKGKEREHKKRKTRNTDLIKQYGISLDKFEEMLKVDYPCCPICDEEWSDKKKPCVDHDHTSGRVRGILCSNCNSILGMAHDSWGILESAINYLNKNHHKTL